ncbi:Abc transporter c family member 5 [Globisporangium polare]
MVLQLPGGDAAEIEQNGVNLSGSQKARVCLARACYSDGELLILDSPLAAVDAVVQSEIFVKCICGLLESKTVVLVTHSPEVIASQAATYRIFVADGELICERLERKPRNLYTPVALLLGRPEETEESQAQLADAGRLVQDEERDQRRVAKHMFLEYFDALGGVSVCLFLVVVMALWQAFRIGSDLWLSH